MPKKMKESSDSDAAKVSGSTLKDKVKTHPRKILLGTLIGLINLYNNHSSIRKLSKTTLSSKSIPTPNKLSFLDPLL